MVSGRRFRLSSALALLGLLLQSIAVNSAVIRVFADPDPTYLEQSFRLTFEANEKIDARPDFRPLTVDFEMVGAPNHQSSYNYINSRVSNSATWTVNLIPRRAGNLTIPPVSFGADKSAALPITVLPAASAGASGHPDLFVEVELTPDTAYVQAQLLYIVRIFRLVELTDANLSSPQITAGDAFIEKLAEDRTFRQRRNARVYDVIEKRFAIFPQRSGTLELAPITLQGRIIEGRRSFFDRARAGPVRRVQSKAVQVEVQPIPSSFPGDVWLPASQIELRETWSHDVDDVRVGDPVTRTVALIAQGLTASQLPELIPPSATDALRQYPDQPSLNDQKDTDGILAVRQEKLALVPTEPGVVLIPELEIPWWNTTTDQLEIARLPARRLNIPAPRVETPDPAPTPGPGADSADTEAGPATPPTTSAWFLATLLVTAVWLATVAAWRRSVLTAGRKQPNPSAIKSTLAQPSLKLNTNELKGLCERGEFQTLKTALLQWAARRWPEAPPTNLGTLTERCSSELGHQVQALNAALYGISGEKPDGAALLRALEAEQQPPNARPDPTSNPLQPLYPQAS
jgi:hypothetical protein